MASHPDELQQELESMMDEIMGDSALTEDRPQKRLRGRELLLGACAV